MTYLDKPYYVSLLMARPEFAWCLYPSLLPITFPHQLLQPQPLVRLRVQRFQLAGHFFQFLDQQLVEHWGLSPGAMENCAPTTPSRAPISYWCASYSKQKPIPMIRTITSALSRKPPFSFSAFLFLLLLLGTFLYFYQPNEAPPPALASAELSRTAAANNPAGLAIEYEVIASDIEVDWLPFCCRGKAGLCPGRIRPAHARRGPVRLPQPAAVSGPGRAGSGGGGFGGGVRKLESNKQMSGNSGQPNALVAIIPKPPSPPPNTH